MSKIYSILVALFCVVAMNSCSENDAEQIGGGGASSDVIAFSASENSSSLMTKAAAGFPNNGRIGVVAADYDATTINWESYPEIDNTGATATGLVGETYSFTWDVIKYWPFDNSQLVFLAYSPVAADNSAVTINRERTELTLTLQEDMPDVLYASANETAATTPYSKSPAQKVDLGEFRHALSQLTIEVLGDATMSTDVKLKSLGVVTGARTATLDLLAGDSALTLGPDDNFAYPLVSQTEVFDSNNPITKSVLLFPGSEDVTEIYVTLTDGILEYPHSYMISFFQNTSNSSIPITLERAKNTKLTILVKTLDVTTLEIDLKGVLTEWNERGDFGVIIK